MYALQDVQTVDSEATQTINNKADQQAWLGSSGENIQFKGSVGKLLAGHA